ncbi:MAG: 30S ribosomal protein S15 [Candidatus Pacebacteria bacterium]|nr:30S ribosomal protein S15 [Candidatus Paceibacterota bacterium]
MLTTRKKNKIIKETQIHPTDTGSPEVQIAILSRRIDELANHLKKNKKDNHSRRGLVQMVMDRKNHLKYLESKSSKRYKSIKETLGL